MVDELLDATPTLATESLSDALHPLRLTCAARHGVGSERLGRQRALIASRLIEGGVEADLSWPDELGETGRRSALTLAIPAVGRVELVTVLLEAGARVEPDTLREATELTDRRQGLACLEQLLERKPPAWALQAAVAPCLAAGDLAQLEALLGAGLSVDGTGGWGGVGNTLHLALRAGAGLPLLESLVAAGARPEALDREGRSARRLAAVLSRDDWLVTLSDGAGAPDELSLRDRLLRAVLAGDEVAGDVTTALTDGEWTRLDHQWLGWALRRSRSEAIPGLLALGLSPQVDDDHGSSPLHEAVQRGATAAVDALLNAGAETERRDFDGHRPLELALTAGHPQAVRRRLVASLRSAGAAAGELAGHPAGDAELDAQLASAGALRRVDDGGECFEQAVEVVVSGDVESLRELLELEPALTWQRSRRVHRSTLLHYLGANGIEIERQGTSARAVEVLRLLLDAGVEPDVTCATYAGGPAQTTLMLLASSAWPAKAGLQGELVRMLIEAGADPDGVDGDAMPLASALYYGQTDSVDVLAESARLDDLRFVTAAGRVDLLDDFVDAGGRLRDDAPRRHLTVFGSSTAPEEIVRQAFRRAVQHGRREVIERLVENGVDIDAVDDTNASALHEAAWAGDAAMVDWLLARGADPARCETQFGGVPADWARVGGHGDLAQRLWEAAESGRA